MQIRIYNCILGVLPPCLVWIQGVCSSLYNCLIQVTLTNELTGEYTWYEAVFEVQPCLPLGDISLSTTVRRPVFHELMVYNPLDTPATVNCVVNSLGVSADNMPLTLDPLTRVSKFSHHYFECQLKKILGHLRLLSMI